MSSLQCYREKFLHTYCALLLLADECDYSFLTTFDNIRQLDKADSQSLNDRKNICACTHTFCPELLSKVNSMWFIHPHIYTFIYSERVLAAIKQLFTSMERL